MLNKTFVTGTTVPHFPGIQGSDWFSGADQHQLSLGSLRMPSTANLEGRLGESPPKGWAV